MNWSEKVLRKPGAVVARSACPIETIDRPLERAYRGRDRSHGFTLVELLVTLAIASILLTVVAPNLRAFIHSNELTGAANDFVGHLSLARSEALKRRAATVICKSGGGSTCVTTGTWDGGWILFADVDGDGGWSAGDMLFRTHTPALSSTTLTTASDKIVFDRNGKAGVATSFTFCGAAIGKARTIALNQFGQHSMTPASC